MLKYSFLIALVYFSCICSGQRSKQQSLADTITYSLTDIKHIKLNLKFDWQKKQAYGTATIKIVLNRTTDKIRLDAGFLSIESIKLFDYTNLTFHYNGRDDREGLEIIFDKIYNANSEIEIVIDYHTNYVNESDPNALGGSYGKGIRFFLPTQSTPIKRKQIWNMGESEGNKYLFPCKESPDDLRTTEFIATVDQKLTFVSNGRLLNTTQNSDGTKTVHYKSEYAYPNYLTSFIVGEYIPISYNFQGIPFKTFCYPDEKEAAIASTGRLTNMANYFSKYTGVKYPYSSYAQVMVQDFPFPGLTGQHMVSTISDNMIDDERTHADFLYLWDGVEADALASQWFGNYISPKDWNNVWLTKSLAHYLDGLYGDYKNGHDEYLMWYHKFDITATLGDWAAGIHHPLVVRNIEHIDDQIQGENYVKSRGALVLRMLSKEIGEAKWELVIKHFVKNNSNKSVTTIDFQQSVKAIIGDDMNWFFDQWIYKIGQPHFEVTKIYDDSKKQLQLKIVQIQKLDSFSNYNQVNYFQGKMQIEIDGQLQTIILLPEYENNFTIKVSQAPKYVNVDFENTWICEMTIKKSQSELLYQFENSKDILARIYALNELSMIYKDTATSRNNKDIIYKSMLKVADSKVYWRFRINILTALNGMLSKPYEQNMIALLKKIILHEETLLKANAIWVLGNQCSSDNADIFIAQLNDKSDRVIFNAATALGKTKSPKAYDALLKLKSKPSWKGQSVMAALTGMRLLGDVRAIPIALQVLADIESPRWFLGQSGWDYPVYAASTLASFKKGSEGYEMIFDRFKKSIEDDDINDIFSNLLLITTLEYAKGKEAFDLLKTKYREDANAMNAVNGYENIFKAAIK